MNDQPHWISFLPIVFVMVMSLFTMLAMLAIPIVVFVLVGRKKKVIDQRFTQLAESLGGRKLASSLNALPVSTGKYSIQGCHQGVSYQLNYRGFRKSQPACVTLVIPVTPMFTLSLQKENWDTKLSKQIGMATELEIGDPDFDAEFFIRTNDPMSCRNYLFVPERRAAIRHIHHAGFMLTFTRKHILVVKYMPAPEFSGNTEIVETSELKGILDAVVVLVRGLGRT